MDYCVGQRDCNESNELEAIGRKTVCLSMLIILSNYFRVHKNSTEKKDMDTICVIAHHPVLLLTNKLHA